MGELIGYWFTDTDDEIGSDNGYDRFVLAATVTEEEPLNPKFASKCVPLFIGEAAACTVPAVPEVGADE